jgi:hypothetical protein
MTMTIFLALTDALELVLGRLARPLHETWPLRWTPQQMQQSGRLRWASTETQQPFLALGRQ